MSAAAADSQAQDRLQTPAASDNGMLKRPAANITQQAVASHFELNISACTFGTANKTAAIAGSQAQDAQQASAASDNSMPTRPAANTKEQGASSLGKRSRNRAEQESTLQAKRSRGKKHARESDEEEEKAEEEEAWDVEAIEDVRITDSAERGTSGTVPDVPRLTYQEGLLGCTFRYSALLLHIRAHVLGVRGPSPVSADMLLNFWQLSQ